MKNKKGLIFAAVLLVLLVAVGIIYFVTRPATSAGAKEITIVMQNDAGSREVKIRTDAEYPPNEYKDADGNLRTTKGERRGHGFGVKSIQHVVRQYGGEVSIQAKDHWFTLTVLLPQ